MPRVYRLDAARVLGVSLALLEDKIDQHRSRHRRAAQHTGALVRPGPDPERSASFASPSLAATLIPHRIQWTEEPEFEQFLEIVRDEFRHQIFDDSADLEKYVQESELGSQANPPYDDIFLVAKFAGNTKLNDVVAAILYASYYPTLGLLFISYLARHRRLYYELREKGDYSSAAEIRFKSTNLLLRTLANHAVADNGVIIEVPRDERNEYRKSLFAGYASRLFRCNFYQINIDYFPPIMLNGVQAQDDLLFMPGPRQQDTIDKYRGHLPREEVISLLRFIYRQVYDANYQIDIVGKEKAYRKYVCSLLKHATEQIPDLVSLRRLRSR